MSNEKRFVVKHGLQSQNMEFVSPDKSKRISVSMLDAGTISFSGDSGELFSVTDTMSGTIFAVNDISGIPSFEVDDSGIVRIAESVGNVLIGTTIDNGNKLQVSGNTSISGTINANNVIVSGNLTVSGTTTFINSNTLNIGDNIITLNADLPAGTAPSENAGIEVNRGSSATVSLVWDETNDRWTVGSSPFQSGGLYVSNTEVINSSGQWVGSPARSTYISSEPPLNPVEGNLWWDTDIGQLFVYYLDGNSFQWVQASRDILVEGPTGTFTLNGNLIVNDISVLGTLTETSDKNLKTNIATIENAVDIVNKLRGVNFNWINDGKPSMGLIAQEVEEVIPELVKTETDGTKTLHYTAMIGLLIEAVKELSDRLDNNVN